MKKVMTMHKILLPILVILLGGSVAKASGPEMVDRGRAEKFLDIDVHLLAGGSYMTENYTTCYPDISDLNTSMRPAFGAGVGARFNIRNYIGLGTEINFTSNGFNMDMAVVGSGGQSVSNVFQRNTYYKVDFPVYVTFLFNLSDAVRWNVDGGVYYGYGIAGKQKSTIYDTRSNELGQLMMSVTQYNADFYKDHRAFINSYDRGDIGLHLATGLTFSGHLRVGIRAHIGMSNLANSIGLVRPDSHTMDFMATVGWQF